MTYEENVKEFIKKINEIKAENPAYHQPGDGSNGLCDCIGLIIGAVKRMGYKWTGIHGSNWAARKEVANFKKIVNSKELKVGDIVFKAYKQGEKSWDLPARYKKGGAYYTGDLQDYYHVGVVTSVTPLCITHMTTPTVKVDTSIGKWSYYGQLKILGAAGPSTDDGDNVQDTINVVYPSAGSKAIVTAPSGKYVKMRQYPSKSCRTWVNVPVESEVEIVEPGEEWAKINFGKRKGWYMMAQFLKIIS